MENCTSKPFKNSELTRDDFDGGPISLNNIDAKLYLGKFLVVDCCKFVYLLIVLGNVSAAVDVDTLQQCKITHILTLDTCPLPRKIIEMRNVKVKFIHLVDQPKEDILSYLQETDCFINEAIENGIILVHWYVFH